MISSLVKALYRLRHRAFSFSAGLTIPCYKLYTLSMSTQYIQDLQSLPHLSSEDLTELSAMYELTRSVSARNAIIEYFLTMVPQLLYRYATCGIDREELLQIANLKIVEVINSLPDIEVSDLRAYLITSINHAILNTIEHYKNQGFISPIVHNRYDI